MSVGRLFKRSLFGFIVGQVIDGLSENNIIQYTLSYFYILIAAYAFIGMIRIFLRLSIKRYLKEFVKQRNIPTTLNMKQVISDTNGYFVFMKYVSLC